MTSTSLLHRAREALTDGRLVLDVRAGRDAGRLQVYLDGAHVDRADAVALLSYIAAWLDAGRAPALPDAPET